jgi:3-methylcrotonyl-CoA carboxylase alpha subunit
VLTFAAEGDSYNIRLSTRDGGLAVRALGQEFVAQATETPDGIRVALDDQTVIANVVAVGDERHVFHSGMAQRFTLIDRLAHADEEQAHAGHLSAPMSGTIVAVHVKLGEAVERGTPLLVLEAMKMEHTIAAPGPGKVSAIHFRTGDQVSEGADLIDVDDTSSPSV